MKKAIFLLPALLLVLVCSSFVAKADPTIVTINAPFYIEELPIGNFNIKQIDGTDYISTQDTSTILKSLAKQLNGESECIDNLKTKNIIMYSTKLTLDSINLDFQSLVDFKENTIYVNDDKALKLDDLGLKLINDKGIGYMPLLCLNFLIGQALQVSKNEGKYYVVYPCELTLNPFSPEVNDENMPRNLKQRTFLYFLSLLAAYNDSVKSGEVNLKSIKDEYLTKAVDSSDNFSFYNILNEAAKELKDIHTEINSTGYSYEGSFKSYKTVRDEKLVQVDMTPQLSNEFECKDLDSDVGYMRIPTFSIKMEDFKAKVDEMVRQLALKKTVIIDIRDNGGGNPSFIYLLENLVKEKFVLYNLDHVRFNELTVNDSSMKTDGKLTEIKRNSKSYLMGKLILLTDRYSLSAAHLTALAFKSNGMGVIIGEKTTGGSHAGFPYILPDNTIITLGTTRAFTDANGNCFEEGLDPDIQVTNQVINGKDAILEAALAFAKKN